MHQGASKTLPRLSANATTSTGQALRCPQLSDADAAT
jgi:hypothetical protein